MKRYLFEIASAGALAAAFAVIPATADAQGLLTPNRTIRRPGAANATPAASTPSAQATASASAAGDDGDASSDLNFKDAPVDMVLEVYGKLVGRTVLKDPQTPSANITLQTRPGQKLTKEDQTEALVVVLEMNGVHLENYGEKFVRALPRKDARKEGIPFFLDADEATLEGIPDGMVISANISFKNITTEEAQKALEGFKSNSGLLQVFERTNSIVVTDTKHNIVRMAQIAKLIDISTPVNEIVRVVQIKHAAAEEVQAALQKIVEDAMKYQEKDGKAQQNAQNANRASNPVPPPTLLRRPSANGQQPAAPTSLESLVTSVSDADRGMIRGRVLIVPDQRSNKLIIVTNKSNMDFFEKVIEALDVETTPDVQVKVYRLKYADAEDAADMINDLIGNSSSSKSSSRQNQNPTARTGQGGNLTRGAGTMPARTASSNQRSGEAKAGELSKDNTTVLADKRINGLVVMTQKELVPVVESIIESMDVKLSQVLIETAIIEVTLGDDLNTGVDWVLRGREHGQVGTTKQWQKVVTGYDADNKAEYEWQQVDVPVYGMLRDGFVNNGNFGLGGGGGTASGILSQMVDAATNATGAFFGGANPIGGGINYLLKSDKLNLAAVIKASKSDSRAKYIASPVIMTVDNKEATIDATEARKFFNGYETSSSYSTYVRTPKYDSEDIGIKIKVKPKINPNGTVMLNVDEEYSQLGAGQSILVDNGDSAVVDTYLTRKMTADVLLDNRQSVILGGLTERYVSNKETGIPILKDIPWIGKWLFGSVTQTESRKELLVFMTPYVLDDAEAAQAEALRRKRSMSDARPWDDHGWSASELADPVSKKELLRRLKDEAARQDEERQNRLAVEKWKLDRAKTLEKMSEAERKFWIEQHRDELEKEEKKDFDRQAGEQEDLKAFAEELRRKDMSAAETKIRESEERERQAGKEVVEGRTEPAEKPGDGAAPAAEGPKEPEGKPE